MFVNFTWFYFTIFWYFFLTLKNYWKNRKTSQNRCELDQIFLRKMVLHLKIGAIILYKEVFIDETKHKMYYCKTLFISHNIFEIYV